MNEANPWGWVDGRLRQYQWSRRGAWALTAVLGFAALMQAWVLLAGRGIWWVQAGCIVALAWMLLASWQVHLGLGRHLRECVARRDAWEEGHA